MSDKKPGVYVFDLNDYFDGKRSTYDVFTFKPRPIVIGHCLD